MFRTTLRVLAAAVTIGLAGLPATSLAVQQNAGTYYDTRMVETYGSPGPLSGQLQLQISPDNIVNGYYRADAGLGTYIPITGGRDGDNIWFDIGDRGDVHVTAKFVKGRIVGSAVDRHDTQYDFTATKAPAQSQ